MSFLNKTFSKFSSHLVLLLITLCSAVLSERHLDKDFWYDEAFTLRSFVWRGPIDVFLDYAAPNNHLVFTSLLSIWLTVSTGLEVADWALRLMPWVFSIISVVALYFGVALWRSKQAAVWAALLWGTSHVFLNFSCQLRGYSLSALEICLAFFLIVNILKAPCYLKLFLYLILSILTVGTIPTNLILLLSLSSWGVIELVRNGRMDKRTVLSSVVLLVSPLLGMFWYLWHPKVRRQFFEHAKGTSYTLDGALQVILDLGYALFYDYRWIIPCLILGFFCFLIKGGARNKKEKISFFLFVLFSFLPIGVLFFKTLYSRNFFPIMPLWFVTMGVLLETLGAWINQRWLRSNFFIPSIVVAILLLAFFRESNFQKIFRQKFSDKRPQGMYYQYYQVDYHPSEIILHLKKRHTIRPVFAFMDKSDTMALEFYANIYNFNSLSDAYSPDASKEFLTHVSNDQELYLISNNMKNARDALERLRSDSNSKFSCIHIKSTGFFKLFQLAPAL